MASSQSIAPLSTISTAGTLTETVSSHSGPWTYVNGGLNTAYQYGVGDELAPTVITAGSGLAFVSGDTLTIQYLSGLVSAGEGFPGVDGNGDTAAPANNYGGSSGRHSPSEFMNPASYPIYLTELVGTFANSSGSIEGTPFAVGNGPLSVVIPVGATQLQLGVNDDIYGDNSGAFQVDVSGVANSAAAPEPEPAAYFLGIVASVLIWIAKARRFTSTSDLD